MPRKQSKAILYQTRDIKNVLPSVAENSEDFKVKSETESVANCGDKRFEYLAGIVVWHDILCSVNTVSKRVDSCEMYDNIVPTKIKLLDTFLQIYRETLNTFTKIAALE